MLVIYSRYRSLTVLTVRLIRYFGGSSSGLTERLNRLNWLESLIDNNAGAEVGAGLRLKITVGVKISTGIEASASSEAGPGNEAEPGSDWSRKTLPARISRIKA